MPTHVHLHSPSPSRPVVIDNGSGSIKAGFSSSDSPRAYFPTIVGYKKELDPKKINSQSTSGSTFVGEMAMANREILDIKSPMDNGIISNFDDMEKIWNHLYHDNLRAKSEDQAVLVTEPSLNPKLAREKTTEIFFEKFKVPSFYLANQSVMGLSASGRTDGIVLDSGYTKSFAVPILEGIAMPHAIQVLEFSGNHLTDYMSRMLKDRGIYVKREIARHIKEKQCQTATNDFGNELKSFTKKTYELPDGSKVELGDELMACPEALFNPKLIQEEGEGIHKTLFNSIFNSNTEIRRQLYANIVLVGGTTMFEGFANRLHKEIYELAPLSTKVKILALPERKSATWIGGSIVSSLSGFNNMAISKKEYEEVGPKIVTQKCF